MVSAAGVETTVGSIKNMPNHVTRCSMPSTAGPTRPQVPAKDSCNMTVVWADIEEWPADSENVVDLTGMDDADKGIAHNHDVDIGSGERCRQCVAGLGG